MRKGWDVIICAAGFSMAAGTIGFLYHDATSLALGGLTGFTVYLYGIAYSVLFKQ